MDAASPPRSAGPWPFDAQALIESLPFPALIVATGDDILGANAGGVAVFGAGAPLRRTFKELACCHRVPGLRSALDDVKRTGEGTTLPGAALGAGPDERSVRDVRLAAVRDAAGRPVAVLLVAVDVTNVAAAHAQLAARRVEHEDLPARREIEREELAAVNEELRVANQAMYEQVAKLEAAERADTRKNQFLVMLAHELRNPLGAVAHALQVIDRLASSDRQVQRALRIADRQLRHEARLLDDLLDVSRIVLDKVMLQTRWVDLRQSVRNVVEAANHAVQVQAIDLRMDLPEEPLGVVGDATRLEQCVGNLLNNAIKFTPAGGRITLRAGREDDRVVVVVRDSGIGIAPDMLERVFDLFSQADASLARSRGGLGIGLTLVKTLVALHGGTVAARSEGLGRGSEFELRLPAATAAAVGPEPAPAVQPRRLRILLVDDNADAREMLRAVLEMNGHAVVEAGDGATAVRLAVERAPDVILLDIGLPGLDGFAVAHRIRQRLGNQVRLVALSGYGDPESRRRARAAGFDTHLVKPVSTDELAKILAAS